jgi:hypothetical protein
MPTDKFLIAPYDKESGLQTDIRPWLVPDTAFSELNNAYVFRGRVRKRFGATSQGRFRINIGVTAFGVFAGNILTILNDPGLPIAVGQAFSINDCFYTINIDLPGPQVMLRTIPGPFATMDIATGAFQLSYPGIADGTPVYFYPALPVMGLLTKELVNINNEEIIGFDARYAYRYIAGTGWDRLALTFPAATTAISVWTGNNSQFFWGCNWSGAGPNDKIFFVTNFNQAEPQYMRYLNGNTWYSFRPIITATGVGPILYLDCARLIVVYKNRLVALNTWESGVHYCNRARYSQIGSPLDPDGWRFDPGRGAAIDAATTEAIITATFVRDRLIVFFERSTWELAFTNNQAQPFTWQKINTELGAESTFSIVPFDRVAIGVGNVGIQACNGATVERIDEKIPDKVFEIHNDNNGIERVYGIRDYNTELLYWSFPGPNALALAPFPNKVLIYNYKTGTWAFNDDTITAFGYFQPSIAINWGQPGINWGMNIPWNGGRNQAYHRSIIAGNQQGFTFLCNADVPTNSPALQITDIAPGAVTTITAINHNLFGGEYIKITGVVGINALNNNIYQILGIVGADEFKIDTASAGVYAGGGLITRVSQISIKTKEYNFYAKEGRNACINKIDFLVDQVTNGQISVYTYLSTNINPIPVTPSILETEAYATVPWEQTAARVWHTIYTQAEGEFIQLQLTMSDAQMRFPLIVDTDFQLHAVCFFANPTSYRFQ